MIRVMLPARDANAMRPPRGERLRTARLAAQEPESAGRRCLSMAHDAAIIVLLFALAIVVFWRTVLKYVIMLTATAVITALGYGAVMMWQNVHHVIR